MHTTINEEAEPAEEEAEDAGLGEVVAVEAEAYDELANAPEEISQYKPMAEVAGFEAVTDFTPGIRPNVTVPITKSDDHPAPDGYATRFLGFSKFRRNIAKSANYIAATAQMEQDARNKEEKKE
jgi:hypothetical protein